MAFCGQCGLLLNSNVARCPRCGTVTEFDVATPDAPVGGNDATIIGHGDNNTQLKEPPYTPLPQSGYPMQSGGTYPSNKMPEAAYPPPGNSPSSPSVQSGGNYPSYHTPVYPSQPGGNYVPPGVSQPGTYPSTDPGYPSPPRKTPKWPFILALLLVFLVGMASAAFFILGPSHLPWLAGNNNAATPTVVPTPQPSPATQTQNTPAAQPSPTSQSSPTPSPTPQPTLAAQATVQQYYTDINNKDYRGAYNLWVNYPQSYAQFQQGFAHTRHDNITLGDTTVQNDGSVQVNITIQSTEDAASGTGTQVSTYQGYYIVGQQSDGTWKIVTANINRA